MVITGAGVPSGTGYTETKWMTLLKWGRSEKVDLQSHLNKGEMLRICKCYAN
ncbi:uncharacterized protein METZ01_LOCUS241348 [marine metagenome]|uniref:Uncharacterized protein n=1 Tax=marine metagenome TaxID=408172 RepID=A0A382HM83_9ZZZZ